ncbi:hypothetical protein F5141DRAFT_1069448 [Pisolithus sp. B1]|nr:hypothetical protein F5141DRAFT_1069448 [Pisolithus sp. B1]
MFIQLDLIKMQYHRRQFILITCVGMGIVLSCCGTVLGTFLIDYLGLKTTMSATRFAMSIMYSQFTDHIAMFAVIYGIFLCFGEVRPGSCLHLLAGRTSPAAIDGQMYAITAMVGKVGAVMGIWGTHTQRLF